MAAVSKAKVLKMNSEENKLARENSRKLHNLAKQILSEGVKPISFGLTIGISYQGLNFGDDYVSPSNGFILFCNLIESDLEKVKSIISSTSGKFLDAKIKDNRTYVLVDIKKID